MKKINVTTIDRVNLKFSTYKTLEQVQQELTEKNHLTLNDNDFIYIIPSTSIMHISYETEKRWKI